MVRTSTSPVGTRRTSPVAGLLIALVRGYRLLLSPLLPARCRFAPSCSRYALEALQVHGAARGGWLTARRVARCHPFHPGGHDPVPPRSGSARPSRGEDERARGDDGHASPSPDHPALPLGARS